MNEEFYNEIIYELNRMKDEDLDYTYTKTWSFRGVDIEYSIDYSDIEDIQIRINGKPIVYRNGVYSSYATANLNGIQTNIELYNYLPNINPDKTLNVKDVKETIDAAVAEFYKNNI